MTFFVAELRIRIHNAGARGNGAREAKCPRQLICSLCPRTKPAINLAEQHLRWAPHRKLVKGT